MASPQQLSPVDGLAQLSFVVQGMLERRAAEHDLSVIQARLLGVLRDRTPTMNELARLLGLDKSSVTGLVDRAERRGLVMRVPSTTDRRVVLVSLADDGRALVSAAAACFEADVLAMLGSLPGRDREALSRLVSRLLAARAAEQGIDLFPAADVSAARLSWRVRPRFPRFPRQTPHGKWRAGDARRIRGICPIWGVARPGQAGTGRLRCSCRQCSCRPPGSRPGRDAERAGERRGRSDEVQRRAFPGAAEQPAHLAAPAVCAHVQKTTDFPGRTTGGRVFTLASSLSLPRSSGRTR
jgi:MarR family transcriptional regulator, lower aerobic nicotinate degradation pathway regulator